MCESLERLLDSLLYEGYALYPYTAGATKNATPTPFGIVYPPAYAEAMPSTFDRLELRCVIQTRPDARLDAQVRFLLAAGDGHEARAQTLALPGATVDALTVRPLEEEARVKCAPDAPRLLVSLSLSATQLDEWSFEVELRAQNKTLAPSNLDRPGALRRSLLSTHPVMRVSGGRFVSALEHPCKCLNTFPVLATPGDDAVIGAAIVLPDHPQIAPESLGGLFDSTEIEEALLLHLHALSQAEREQIERADPTVREMVTRAARSASQDILALHGRVTLEDRPPRDRVTEEPPSAPVGLPDPSAGEETANVGGVTFRLGAKVLISPGDDADLHARMLAGRRATIERILTDYDGKVHFGVTIDEDPGADLMRDTGRYLYFFAPELEVIA